MSTAEKKPVAKGPADIHRFYYKKASCVSKRSSLSLDSVLVGLLIARLGTEQRVRKWVSGQARLAQEAGLDSKSISRAVQENAIRIIADPQLVGKLSATEVALTEQQSMMAQWLERGASASSERSRRL